MTKYSHIKDDGFLDKLDIKVSRNRKIKMNKGLMAMELPSQVDPNFTVEDVVENLKEFAKVANKQYEEHCTRHGINPQEKYKPSKKAAHVGEGININGKFNIDIEQIKKDLVEQGKNDTSLLMGVIPEAVEKGNFERMYISVPGKVNLSFGVPVRSYYSNDSLLEILKEVGAMLEAPVEEDKEIF
jgi:hypothetical protein